MKMKVVFVALVLLLVAGLSHCTPSAVPQTWSPQGKSCMLGPHDLSQIAVQGLTLTSRNVNNGFWSTMYPIIRSNVVKSWFFFDLCKQGPTSTAWNESALGTTDSRCTGPNYLVQSVGGTCTAQWPVLLSSTWFGASGTMTFASSDNSSIANCWFSCNESSSSNSSLASSKIVSIANNADTHQSVYFLQLTSSLFCSPSPIFASPPIATRRVTVSLDIPEYWSDTLSFWMAQGNEMNVTVTLSEAVTTATVLISLRYSGGEGSLLFSPSVLSLSPGETSGVIVAIAKQPSTCATLSLGSITTSGPGIANAQFIAKKDLALRILAVAPVHSLRSTDQSSWVTSLVSASDFSTLDGRAFSEICLPAPYNASALPVPASFCVNTSVTTEPENPPYPRDADSGPFFVIDRYSSEPPDNALMMSVCKYTQSTTGAVCTLSTYVLTTNVWAWSNSIPCYSSGGGTSFSYVLGYGMRFQGPQATQPLVVSRQTTTNVYNEQCEINYHKLFPDFSGDFFWPAFVIPVLQRQSSCSTLWCQKDYKCLRESEICDGAAQCSDGSDEAASLCCKGFYCKRSNQCIPESSLCNGVTDCTSGEDEQVHSCYSWPVVSSNSSLNVGPQAYALQLTAPLSSPMALLDCTKQALAAGSTVIEFADDGTRCNVLDAATGFALFSSAFPFDQPSFQTTAGLTLFANLERGIDLPFCAPDYYCNFQGSTTSPTTCECTCDPGFFGPRCDRTHDVSTFGLVYKINPNATPTIGPDSSPSYELFVSAVLNNWKFNLIMNCMLNSNTSSALAVTNNMFDCDDYACGTLNLAGLTFTEATALSNSIASGKFADVVRNCWLSDASAFGFDNATRTDVLPYPFLESVEFTTFPLMQMRTMVGACLAGFDFMWCLNLQRYRPINVVFIGWVQQATSYYTPPVMTLAVTFLDVNRTKIGTANCTSYLGRFGLYFSGFGYRTKRFCKIDVSMYPTLDTMQIVDQEGGRVRTFDTPQFSEVLSFVAVQQNEPVAIELQSFASFLGGGIACLVAATVAVGISLLLCLRDHMALQGALVHHIDSLKAAVKIAVQHQEEKIQQSVDSVSNTTVKLSNSDAQQAERSRLNGLRWLLTRFLVSARFYRDEGRTRVIWVSAGLSVLALDLAIVGGFLVMYYSGSAAYESNYSVMVEMFRSRETNASIYSPVPFRVYAVGSSNGRSCMVRESLGVASGTVFIAAMCETANNGTLQVRIRAGESAATCDGKSSMLLPSDRAVLSSSIFGSLADPTSYTKVTCGLAKSVSVKYEAFSAFLQSPTATKRVSSLGRVVPEDIREDLLQNWDKPKVDETNLSSTSEAVYTYPRVVGIVPDTTSSYNPCRFESVASGSFVQLARHASLLVQVEGDTFFKADVAGVAANLSRQFSGTNLSSIPQWVLDQGPLDEDLPIGFEYNPPQGGQAVTGNVAGVGASRFYGIRGSFADVGKFYGEQLSVSDGDGVTITMYLKGSLQSYGFAFAVTDAHENARATTSPLLEQLLKMIATGSRDWFATTYNVNLALGVDGPARKLYLIMANALVDANGAGRSVSSPVVLEQWDLEKMGFDWLFNGAWHHVAIILRRENAMTKAQLVIDGITSLEEAAYNLCVDRRPYSLADFRHVPSVAVASSVDERLRMRGVLYTGYFNGGIAKLEFTPTVTEIFELWLSSTKAIRNLNAMSTTPYVALAIILFILGLLSSLLIIPSFEEAFATNDESEKEAAASSQEKYFSIWVKYPASDEEGNRYQTPSWHFAMHAFKLLPEQLKEFVTELELKNKERCGAQFVRLLFTQVADRRGGENWAERVTRGTQPSAEEWLEKVIGAQKMAEATGIVGIDAPELSKPNATGKRGLTWKESSDQAKEAGEGEGEGGEHEGAVETGDLHHGATQQIQTQQGDVAVAVASAEELKHLILPILTVLQSVYVWMSTTNIPRVYHLTFRSFFSFICADITEAIPGIPPIVTPLLQMFLGLVIIGTLYFILHDDERSFLVYLGKYVVKRDVVEARELAINTATVVDGAIHNEVHLGSEDALDPQQVDVFPWKACEEVDLLALERTARTAQEAPAKLNEQSGDIVGVVPDASANMCPSGIKTLRVTSSAGRTFLVAKRNMTDLVISDETGGPNGMTATEVTRIGCRCLIHGDRLANHMQTNVYPFYERAKCSVVVGGVACQNDTGTMYTCRRILSANEVDAHKAKCGFAVCDEHYRGTAADVLLSHLVAFRRSTVIHGNVWLIATLTLLAANALYTPVMKTAFMILGCHPYFQCTFPICWQAPVSNSQVTDSSSRSVPSPGAVDDRRNFALAALMSGIVVIVFGVGLPLVLSLLLRRRRLMMIHAFFSDEYELKYKDKSKKKEDEVVMSEWFRFSQTDPTVLATWYKSFEFRWIVVPPILLAWKVVLLVPPVFIAKDTFGQSAGIAAVEVAYGLFLIITEPCISPMADIMHKLGATHQMIFLAFLNLDTHLRYHGRGSLGKAMVATTAVYLATCLACILWSKIAPAVLAQKRHRDMKHFFEGMGMHFSRSTTLFLVPQTAQNCGGSSGEEEKKTSASADSPEDAVVEFEQKTPAGDANAAQPAHLEESPASNVLVVPADAPSEDSKDIEQKHNAH